MTGSYKLERTWKKVAVVYLKVLFHDLPEDTEREREK